MGSAPVFPPLRYRVQVPYVLMLVACKTRYSKPEDFSIVRVPLPTLRDEDVLVKVQVSQQNA
jgi:hypothetical protein